ncbi:Fur family transcriptional regulator [Salegentibacter chungangensis]|uniref:Fur family transcriptional regulator n=1 Tax=Salegentibacter chungangensis TaxID=1335724 RepID=A0ABW3NTE0_9FLAO
MRKTEDFLTKKGVRPTAMRMLVLDFLFDKKIAVALTDVEEAFENAERTTLYRSIKTFENKGIVHQIDDGTGVLKYALCEDCDAHTHSDLHLHFHCTRCNETHCLTNHQIPQINLPEGYSSEDVNLVVKGLCDQCNE